MLPPKPGTGRANSVEITSRPGRRDALIALFVAVVLLAGGCGEPVLYCGNTVTTGEQDTFLVALLERGHGLFRQRLGDVEVSFHAGGEELARGRTNSLGYVVATARIPAGVGTLQARTRVDDQALEDQGHVLSWSSERCIIVCDIDGTVSITDVETLLFDPTDTGSQPLPGAAETLGLLSEKYNLLFLTGRPVFLRKKTLDWLKEKRFPPAPVIFAPEVREGIRVEPFKRRVIGKVKQLYPHALIGIGNAETDAHAYRAEGMLGIIVDKDTPRRFRADFVALPDWNEVREFFHANDAILSRPSTLQSTLSAGEILSHPQAGIEKEVR